MEVFYIYRFYREKSPDTGRRKLVSGTFTVEIALYNLRFSNGDYLVPQICLM